MKQIFSFEDMTPGKAYKLFYNDMSGENGPKEEFDGYYIFIKKTGAPSWNNQYKFYYSFLLVEKDHKFKVKMKTYPNFISGERMDFACYEI